MHDAAADAGGSNAATADSDAGGSNAATADADAVFSLLRIVGHVEEEGWPPLEKAQRLARFQP